uniref:Uncharacterized protein n=1 Tax=Tetraselmis sp. GSL018 TaxID=582737 RepID=A0A061S2V2_9CHLO
MEEAEVHVGGLLFHVLESREVREKQQQLWDAIRQAHHIEASPHEAEDPAHRPRIHWLPVPLVRLVAEAIGRVEQWVARAPHPKLPRQHVVQVLGRLHEPVAPRGVIDVHLPMPAQ